MSFIQPYINMWKNFVNFSARTNRNDFWMAILVNFIVGAVLNIIGSVISTDILMTIYSLAVMIPAIALYVRRLRDMGKGWTWLFIVFIPLVGFIWLIVLFCKPSVAEDGVPTV